jgi:hypothetical protein
MRGEALAWAREVAASSEFTAAIRKDAEAFIASAGGRDEPFTPRGLPALAAAARAALASLAPPPA